MTEWNDPSWEAPWNIAELIESMRIIRKQIITRIDLHPHDMARVCKVSPPRPIWAETSLTGPSLWGIPLFEDPTLSEGTGRRTMGDGTVILFFLTEPT